MSAEVFAAKALSFPEAVEGCHLGQVDFRVAGKIFATIHKGGICATVKLSPGDQELLRAICAEGAVAPEAGAWGARGWTRLALADVGAREVETALAMAWRTTAPKRLLNKEA